MSIISDIFSGGTEGILKGVKDVVGAFKADPLELAKLQHEITKAETEFTLKLAEAQTKINEIEAASQDKFVSRWRPACGWTCVAALGYDSILQPILAWASLNFGWYAPPMLNTELLMFLLSGLLGLAGLRSYEKTRK